MSDIVFDGMVFDRLREIGDQSDRIAALESEVTRLRLTEAEREALRFFLARWGDEANTRHADALHALLERTK